jgi:hypothetical protein
MAYLVFQGCNSLKARKPAANIYPRARIWLPLPIIPSAGTINLPKSVMRRIMEGEYSIELEDRSILLKRATAIQKQTGTLRDVLGIAKYKGRRRSLQEMDQSILREAK